MAVKTENVDWGLKVYGWLESEVLTEENTDTLIDSISKYVPVVPTFVVARILDRMLPELALDAVRESMQRLGWLPDSDVFMEKGNPFRPGSG